MEVIEYFYKDEYNIKDLVLKVEYTKYNTTSESEFFSNSSSTKPVDGGYFYYLNESYLGPFNDTDNINEIRKFLGNVQQMDIMYDFKTIIPFHFAGVECFRWAIKGI